MLTLSCVLGEPIVSDSTNSKDSNAVQEAGCRSSDQSCSRTLTGRVNFDTLPTILAPPDQYL